MNPIIDKLKKILRLATGNSNPHEAEVALQKAQQIAIEHKIDISSLNCEEKEDYQKDFAEMGQRFTVCQRYVNWVIDKYFNVKIILSGGRMNGRRIFFIGKASDVEFAKWLNLYLNETFMNAWRNHKERFGAPTHLRESFLFGLYKGLSAKLEENKKKVESDKFAQMTQERGAEHSDSAKKSYELVIFNEVEQLNKAVEHFFPKLKSGPAFHVKSRDLVTMQAGFAKGQTIKTNRPLTYN